MRIKASYIQLQSTTLALVPGHQPWSAGEVYKQRGIHIYVSARIPARLKGYPLPGGRGGGDERIVKANASYNTSKLSVQKNNIIPIEHRHSPR